MTLTDVLKDFAYLSVLLMAGYELRKHIVLFQKYFIPSSLIAGVLGMLLSKNWLGIDLSRFIFLSVAELVSGQEHL